MEKLLAVSAQEDDLNRSLQNLDALLIQARKILQASYAEVQRLLPLRQQVMRLTFFCSPQVSMEGRNINNLFSTSFASVH